MATQKTVVEVDIQGTEKVESMRTQMRKLREELARLPEGTAEFNKVQRKLGELTDKVGDLSKSVNTLSGDPLERLNNSFSMIGSSILSLDFGQAQTGLKGMTSAVKDFKFKDATTALKGFSTTIFDLGKALLLNPLFSIPAAIVLLIQNLDDLTKMGGKVGAFFGAIKNQIDAVWNSVVAFLDATGIIDSKAEERNKKAEKDAKEAAERQKKREEQAKKDAEKLQHEKEKLAEEAAKKEAERLKKIKEDQKSLTEFLKSEQEKRYQDTLANDDKLVRQAQVNYEEKKKLAHGNAELLKQLEQEYQKQIAEIRDKETLKIQGRDATRVTSSTTANGIVLQNNQKEVEQAIANQKRIEEGEQALQDAKYRIAADTIGGLMDLNSALVDSGLIEAKKGFQIAKTLGIAQTIMSTIEGAQNAFTTANKSAITTVFPAYPFIQAGIATAAGLAKVASIRAQQFNGGGGSQPSTSMGGGSGSVSTPSAPAVDLSYLNKGSNKAQPVQAYVLATNVSSAQEAEQKIKDQSKIIK
jgi:hypothetical protein